MLRSAALKLGSGLALAAAGQSSKPSHASARHTTTSNVVRATPTKVDSPGNNSEEAWLDVTLNENELVFTPTEVNEVVEEIRNLTLSDEEDETDKADSAIDKQNAPQESEAFNQMLRASQIMLRDPEVQNGFVNAIRRNNNLREIIEDMTDTTLIPTSPLLEGPALEESVPRRSNRTQGNAMKTLVEDLGHLLSTLIQGLHNGIGEFSKLILKAVKGLKANILSSVSGIKHHINDPNKPGIEKVSGSVFLLAAFIMVVLIAKKIISK